MATLIYFAYHTTRKLARALIRCEVVCKMFLRLALLTSRAIVVELARMVRFDWEKLKNIH